MMIQENSKQKQSHDPPVEMIKARKTDLLSGCLYRAVRIFGMLPMPLLYGLSRLAYLWMFHLFAYRKMVVIQNICRSFPEKKYGEIKRIVEGFYRSFCDHIAEILKSVSASPLQQKEKIELIDFEQIRHQIALGRHVIAGMGHCGNWEILNVIPFILDMKAYAIYKPLSTKCMDSLLLKIRSRFGMSLITDKSVARHLMTNENPSLYFILADQCPAGIDETPRIHFLHQSTRVFWGIEKLARKTNAGVFYLHVIQTSRGRYRVECKEISTNASCTGEEEITRCYLRLLEQNIHEYPSGWLWSHKRWKR
ncbi:MAG: lysophospholipid acyltransferase family protein [Tannerella sp.]|nr:lysophospholipid acyltransferase family protein [Tannerella sp.]